ncbi:MAG: hypothetical protein VX643_01100 [Chloroflexota bacterium]|nr:hypothetical protein [Chloroflexota bacterium]|tara:strand:- start:232 stop:561 length:330 start_codon:yes stop_codon:yes gene_type:complete
MDTLAMPGLNIEERLQELGIKIPIDPEVLTSWRAVPRLENLTGKVGGFLGNKKANAEVLLKDVKELLDQRFELKDSVLVDKFIYSRPASEEIIESLASECDFVVTAIAD